MIERIGGRKAILIDARVITAMHQDLPQLMKAGMFREDLYFRPAEMVIGRRLSAVPEPATWAMMFAGFGMIGAGARSRLCQTVGFTYA